jgi:hypothetical protein
MTKTFTIMSRTFCRRRAPGKAAEPLHANHVDIQNFETRMASVRTGG